MLNKRLLLRIADTIEASPGEFNQSFFGIDQEEYVHLDDRKYRGCNTPCCVAGHALLLSGVTRLDTEDDVERKAASLLGIGMQEAKLFFMPTWPQPWFHRDETRAEAPHIYRRAPGLRLRPAGIWPRAHHAPDILRRIAKGDIILKEWI